MLNLQDLFTAPLDWQDTEEKDCEFSATVQGQELRLRLNDFPAEPLCTIIWAGGQQDFEEMGKQWTLPRHRSE